MPDWNITVHKISDSPILVPSMSAPPFLVTKNLNVHAISDYDIGDDSLIKDVDFMPYYVHEKIKLIKFEDIRKFLERNDIKHNVLKSKYGNYFIIDKSIAELFREVGVNPNKINYEKYENWYITGQYKHDNAIQYSMIKVTDTIDNKIGAISTNTLQPLNIDNVEYILQCEIDGETTHQACVNRLNKNLECITSSDNIPEFQINDLVYYSDNQISNDSDYMNETGSNSVSLIALSSNNNTSQKSGKDLDWVNAMKDQYGFTEEDTKLIISAYEKFVSSRGYSPKNKEGNIWAFFGNLAALFSDYSGDDEKFKLMGNLPTHEDALSFFDHLGVDSEKLKDAIVGQHKNCGDKRDFAHECAIISIMASDTFAKCGAKLLDNPDALVGYKGDIYSGSMGTDDMKSDVAAVNIYRRMRFSTRLRSDIFKEMMEYNQGISNGSINEAEEFLKGYDNGNPEKGMSKLKKEMNHESLGTKRLSAGVEQDKINGLKKEFIDYLEKQLN